MSSLALLIAAEARLPMWPMFVLIGVMFYLMILAPDRKRRSEHSQMLETLKKNDRVVTIGGIFGTVISVYEDEVTLRVDESAGTKIRVLRSAISRVEDGKGERADKGGDKSGK